MKMNKIGQSIKHGIATALLIGVAVIGLATGFESSAQAQERFRAFQLQNTAFGTTYFLSGGTNQSQGEGTYVYTGGTNSVTITNNAGGGAVSYYSNSTAIPFPLGFAQNVPVWWDLAATASGTGTSNLVFGLDLSFDNVNWISNAVTATLALTGSNNLATAVVYFPLGNGGSTNIFSGYTWGRWSYISTTQTNPVTVSQNQLQVYR
jgi:hypothetical protein